MKVRTGLLTLASTLVVACSSPAASVPAVTSSPPPLQTAAATPEPTVVPTQPAPTLARIVGSFDIGDGRELYLQCTGSGSPTILLEAGDEDTGSGHYRLVMPDLVTETRTCTYDRLGVGRSSVATGCRQLDDILDDLEALLAAAAIDGPYLLVGASGGGFLMAGFAARHPDQVAGMVFVETPKALTAELYPEVLPEIACDAPGNVEHRDYLAVEHAVWDNREELGDFPVTVISNDHGDSVEPNTDEATNVEDQRGWLDLSSGTVLQVVVTSGHDVAGTEPDLVVDEILAVLAGAR